MKIGTRVVVANGQANAWTGTLVRSEARGGLVRVRSDSHGVEWETDASLVSEAGPSGIDGPVALEQADAAGWRSKSTPEELDRLVALGFMTAEERDEALMRRERAPRTFAGTVSPLPCASEPKERMFRVTSLTAIGVDDTRGVRGVTAEHSSCGPLLRFDSQAALDGWIAAGERARELAQLVDLGFISTEEEAGLRGEASEEGDTLEVRYAHLETQNRRFETLLGQQRAEIAALKQELAEERMARRGRR